MGTATIGSPRYDLNGYIAFGVIGNTQIHNGSGYDGYYRSLNYCSNCDSDYIGFGSSVYTNDVGSPCQVTVNYQISSVDGDSSDYQKVDNGWNLTNICNTDGDASVVPRLSTGFYNGGVANLLSYAGSPCGIYIRSHGGRLWYTFYIQPAELINGQLDKNNLGCLWYCGTNVPASKSGDPIYTVNEVNGNTVNFSGHNIDDRLTPITWQQGAPCPGFEISPKGDTDVYISFDGSTPDFNEGDDGEPTDSDCVTPCQNCGINIDDCCNDDIFTSDLEQFSSMQSPDTYINPDNGEEERLPYNGCLHIARAIEITAKVFFSLGTKFLCMYDCHQKNKENELKAIKDKLSEFVDEFKTKWFGFEIFVESNHSAYGGKASMNYRSDDDLDFLDKGE